MKDTTDAVTKNSYRIFLGTTIIIFLFIFAVKFNVMQAKLMEGEQMPEVVTDRWISKPLTQNHLNGKETVIFFYKDGVEVCQQLLAWSKRQVEGEDNRIVIIILELDHKNGAIPEKILNIKDTYQFFIAVDSDNSNRKNFRNASYATYYITNRLNIIEEVNDFK